METLHACPVCSSSHVSLFMNVQDHSISKETFEIFACADCSLKFTNPRPSASEIGVYYESDDYISHSNKRTGLIPFLYQTVRNITLKQKLKLILSFHPEKGQILDYGCGTGEFLNTMRSNGWSCLGLEPGEKAASEARRNYDLDVKAPEALNDIAEGSLDVITLWHVLEHVHDLHHTMDLLMRKLKDSGTIFIAVPNAASWDAKHYGPFWAAYDVPRHLYHFHSGSMGKLFSQHGINMAAIKPMKWDSFYVSMLSEKYKGHRAAPILGVISGARGNISGGSSLNNYSSLIFIGQKSL